MLSAVELQAVVSHEIGHEYFWDEELRLRNRKDSSARREIELRCDAIAILTLLQLDLDPALVASAAAKVTGFNERRGMRIDGRAVSHRSRARAVHPGTRRSASFS